MASDVASLFAALTVIVAGAWAARALFRRMHLPGVVGELLFGIALGPSLLGWFDPRLHTALLPASMDPVLKAFSNVGLALFVMLVGLEMAWNPKHARAIGMVAAGGLAVPLAAGILIAANWPGAFFAHAPGWANYALVGVVLTVSALPVLARILEDLGRLRDPIGVIAMGSATVDDVAGWLILPLALGASGSSITGSLGLDLLLLAILLAAAIAGATLLKQHWDRPEARPPRADVVFPPLVAMVLAAAWLTETAGLNAVLGPLAVGAAASRVPALRDAVHGQLGDLTRVVFLPVFFVVSGAAVNVHQLTPSLWGGLLLLAAAATVSKVLGCGLGAFVAGLDMRSSAATGILLNARGAVGLVVANVGYSAGLVSGQGYTMLVLVVALTTLGAPILAKVFLRPAGPPRVLRPAVP